jgi:hypothetical protein
LAPTGTLAPAIASAASAPAGKRSCRKSNDTCDCQEDNQFSKIVHFHFSPPLESLGFFILLSFCIGKGYAKQSLNEKTLYNLLKF